jgi:hypothetical protein
MILVMKLVLLVLFLAPAVSAQLAAGVNLVSDDPAQETWQERAIQGGTLPGGAILWATGYASAERQPFNVGAGLSLVAEFRTLALSLGYSDAGPLFWHGSTLHAVSVSAGAHTRIGGIRLSALGGPAIVWGLDAAPRPDETFSSIGAVLETSILIVLGRHADFGLRAHANLNSNLVSAGFGPALRVKLYGR